MIATNRVYRACDALFAEYPLAARVTDESGDAETLVLMLRSGDEATFFILLRDSGAGEPVYSLCPWRADGIVSIGTDDADVPDLAVEAVTSGIPIPRNGSMFGWAYEGTVPALIVVHALYTPLSPEPSWSVMPLAGAPQAQWPPFTSERLFGSWFWNHYRAGKVVLLDDLIAAKPDTIFWIDTYATVGSDCCAVTRDIRTPERLVLRRGRYADSGVLRTGKRIPSLAELLADDGKVDLAPRFGRYSRTGG